MLYKCRLAILIQIPKYSEHCSEQMVLTCPDLTGPCTWPEKLENLWSTANPWGFTCSASCPSNIQIL